MENGHKQLKVKPFIRGCKILLVLKKWPCNVLNCMLLCSHNLCNIRARNTSSNTSGIQWHYATSSKCSTHISALLLLHAARSHGSTVIYIPLSSQSEHLVGSKITSNGWGRKLIRMAVYAFNKWEMNANVYFTPCGLYVSCIERTAWATQIRPENVFRGFFSVLAVISCL